MADEAQLLSELQDVYEDPKFLSTYYEMYKQAAAIEESQVYLQTLAEVFQPGKFQGTRLLDFGCGPIIHKIGSATRQFDEIILAEFSAVNREALTKWLNKESDALDWKPVLELVAKAEGYSDISKGVVDLESRIRRSVKRVVPCDILSENILPTDVGEFDVVSTFLCIDACRLNSAAFKEAIKKLGKYVKKDGGLVIESSLNCTFYSTYKKVHVIPVTEELIKEAIKEAGFALKEWHYQPNELFTEMTDMSGSVTLVAYKE